MPVCRGLHSQLTRMRCIRGLVPALWGSPEGDERLASWIWPWSLKPGWAPVASCRPGPSRENPLHARDRKASAPEARGAMFLINSQVGPPRPASTALRVPCPALLLPLRLLGVHLELSEPHTPRAWAAVRPGGTAPVPGCPWRSPRGPSQDRQHSLGWPSRAGGCGASQDESVLRQQPDQT